MCLWTVCFGLEQDKVSSVSCDLLLTAVVGNCCCFCSFSPDEKWIVLTTKDRVLSSNGHNIVINIDRSSPYYRTKYSVGWAFPFDVCPKFLHVFSSLHCFRLGIFCTSSSHLVPTGNSFNVLLTLQFFSAEHHFNMILDTAISIPSASRWISFLVPFFQPQETTALQLCFATSADAFSLPTEIQVVSVDHIVLVNGSLALLAAANPEGRLIRSYRLDSDHVLIGCSVSEDGRFMFVNVRRMIRQEAGIEYDPRCEIHVVDFSSMHLVRKLEGSFALRDAAFLIYSSPSCIPNYPVVASGCEDGRVHLWNYRYGSPLARLAENYNEDMESRIERGTLRKDFTYPCLNAVSLHPTYRNVLAAAGDDGMTRIWI